MKLIHSLLSVTLAGYNGQSLSGRSIGNAIFSNRKIVKAMMDVNLDWIQPHNGPRFVVGEEVKFIFNDSDKEYIGGLFEESNTSWSIQDDLDALVNDSFDAIRSFRLGGHDFEVYNDLSEIESWLLSDVNAHANANVHSIGKTIENRDIWAVEIVNRPVNMAAESELPKIIVDCGIHAREWVSPAFCQHLINDLLAGSATSWKNSVHWIILPLLNPDGYAFSWTDDRLWRKNRRVNAGTTCRGVDLNRNYDIKWATKGSSSNKCSQTYHGTSAFSEPESFNHKVFQSPLKFKKAYLTFHSFSEVIIFPFSTAHSDEASNRAELTALGQQMVNGIKSVHGKTYGMGEGAEIFGLAAGGSDDWSHADGTPISYTVELRDTGVNGFLLPESQIKPTCEENMKGVEAVFNHVKPSGSCTSCPSNEECWFQNSSNSFVCNPTDYEYTDGGTDGGSGPDCKCNFKPVNCQTCTSSCVAVNGKRVTMRFTCPATGFTQTLTGKCKKFRKQSLDENCGSLSCSCASELTVAMSGTGASFECTKAKKKPTYRVFCDLNGNGKFNSGEPNQQRKVKCKRGQIKKNPFSSFRC